LGDFPEPDFLGPTIRRGGFQLSDDAVALLKKHSYPSNVRELYSVLMRAAALAQGSMIQASDLEFLNYDDEPKERTSIGTIRRELAAAHAELVPEPQQ
jgi:DNA-binding NtrC family response regulator